MVQVMHHFGFVMFFIERLPNHGQEFISLNRLLQEGSRASIEYTFFVCSPVTPGQDDYRNDERWRFVFNVSKTTNPSPAGIPRSSTIKSGVCLRASEIAPIPSSAQ
jgi:hypothetical protein